MVAHGRVELLAHPLSQKYLQMKWNSYGKYFHLANLLFYCIFLAFVTIFAAQLMDDNTMNTTEMKDNSTHNGSHTVANQEVLMHYRIPFSSNIEVSKLFQLMIWK
jgi:transient receptor potential cation channel subfamily A protein 1